MKSILVLTFESNKTKDFFSGTFIRRMTVRYFDIVLRLDLNSFELTEILKMVKYHNM